MPVTHEEQTQDSIHRDSAPLQTMSSFLCSPCLSRVCVFVCRRGVAGAQVAMWHLQGEQCRCWGYRKMLWSRRWPLAMLLQPGEYSARPRLAKRVGAAGGERKRASNFWAACSYLHVQTSICICKYPAVHSVTCYAEAKAGVYMFNGSSSEVARWNHGCYVHLTPSPIFMGSIWKSSWHIIW